MNFVVLKRVKSFSRERVILFNKKDSHRGPLKVSLTLDYLGIYLDIAGTRLLVLLKI